METIVIKVWRGLVDEVYATSGDMEVVVIDADCPDEEQPEIEIPKHRIY